LRVDFSEEQKALRAELRAYFGTLLTPEVRESLVGPDADAERRRVIRRMGADGWLGVGWPAEVGGQGRTALEQLIWFDEARRSGAPLPFVTLNTVGPTLMAAGTEEQKRRFLPAILSGEIQFAIGYTEPAAGTDLAALETRAARDGDQYVVNGTKVFTSGADSADFIWLACRTDPDAPKHRGISILIVDTSLPGFSFSPIHTVGGGSTTMTYYRDVRVPADMLVGEENRGWKLITLQLNHERVGLAAMSGIAERLLEDTLEWVAGRETDSGPLGEVAWVQGCLGEAWARLESVKVMNWQMAWSSSRGGSPPHEPLRSRCTAARRSSRSTGCSSRSWGRLASSSRPLRVRRSRESSSRSGAAARSTPSAGA
jgi:alkylation response protein AidB-like acyl-CoA dehydrogenase